MARRRRTDRSASNNYLCQLSNVVENQLERVRSADRLVLDHDDYLSVFVPFEHRKAFMEVAQVVRTNNSQFRIVWEHHTNCSNLRLDVDLHEVGGIRHPLIYEPTTYIAQSQDPLSAITHERITSWVTRRWELGVAFGRVREVLKQLDDVCHNPAQVRYYWPALLTLCKEGGLGDIAEKSELKPGNPPPLSVGLREALRLAAGTVTAASMVGKSPAIKPPVEITFADAFYCPRKVTEELGEFSVL
jgi:hypothetical protein